MFNQFCTEYILELVHSGIHHIVCVRWVISGCGVSALLHPPSPNFSPGIPPPLQCLRKAEGVSCAMRGRGGSYVWVRRGIGGWPGGLVGATGCHFVVGFGVGMFLGRLGGRALQRDVWTVLGGGVMLWGGHRSELQRNEHQRKSNADNT